MFSSTSPSKKHFFQLIEENAENINIKDAVAIYIDDENKITYSELNKQVNQLAHYLLDKKNGLSAAETRIGLFFNLSIDYIISVLAIMKAGLSFIPFSANTEVQRLQELVKQSHIKLMLSSYYLKNNLFLTSGQYTIIYIDSQQNIFNTYPTFNPQHNVDLAQLAYVHNTSGSTGKPKQVLINHAGLLNCATDLINRLSITEHDKTAAFADISFDAHIAEMMMTLGTGATLYLVPHTTRLDYKSLTKYYNSHGITVSTLTPSVLNALSPNAFSSLRVLLSTGEAVTQKIVKKWCEANPNLLFVNGYGPAEVTIATSIAILKPDDPIHIGTPIKGLTLYVLEKEPKDAAAPKWAPPGERGELYIGGIGVGRGYSDEKLTVERFKTIPDPNDPNKTVRLYQTRDEVRYEITENNSYRFYLTGRLDRQVKIYAKLICPEEIEALLLNDDVIQAQIDPQKTAAGHPNFIAYLHVKAQFDLYEYYTSIAKKLPADTAPSRWVISEKSLLNTSSKNALSLLNQPAVRAHAHSPLKPTRDIEKALAEIWKQVLEISEEIEFTLDDNFFMLGGTSLQAANLLIILREQFQLKLSPSEFIYTATLGALGRCIQRLRNENNKINSPVLLKGNINQTEAPLFLIHSLMGDAELDYEKLANNWNNQRPLYGISSRSFNNIEDMDTSLEAIAADYIAAIKSIQPNGPYLLGGWSAGGLIAYVMSQQLKNQNEKIYLHVIDSETFSAYHQKNRKEYSAYLVDLFERKLSAQLGITALPINKNVLATLPKLKQVYIFFQALLSAVEKINNPQMLLSKKGLIVTIRNSLLAILNYVATTKLDNATLWFATETQKQCANENLGWSKNEIEFTSIQNLDGNHESILLDSTSAKTLGTRLEKICAQQIKKTRLDEIINYLESSQLSYVENAEDQDLYTPLEGSYDLLDAGRDLFGTNFKRYKLLEDIVVPFINNPEKKTLLIVAEAGSGKTKFSEKLTKYLWQSFSNLKIIPIYIRLSSPKIKNFQDGIIEDTLKAYGLIETQIKLLLGSNVPFCFIFDGVDELIRKYPKHRNFYLNNDVHNKFPTSHCIFTSRLGVFNSENYEQLFEPMDIHGKSVIVSKREKTIMIAPFDEASKKSYISKYIKNRPDTTLGYTDVDVVYQRIQSIAALNKIVGQPIFLMMTMKILPYLEAFYKEKGEVPNIAIQIDLFHMYTHDLFARASDKKKEAGTISVNKYSVYDCILDYSIYLAQKMKQHNYIEISEEDLFSNTNPYKSDEENESKASNLHGFKMFFSRKYDPALYNNNNNHYDMVKTGREGCELLRPRGKPGSFIYSFIHDAFVNYFAELSPKTVKEGRRKIIQDFIDGYKVKHQASFQPILSSSSNFFQSDFSTNTNFNDTQTSATRLRSIKK